MFKKIFITLLCLGWIIVLSAGTYGLITWQKQELKFFSVKQTNARLDLQAGDLVMLRNVPKSKTLILEADIKSNLVIKIPLAGYIFDFLSKPIAMIAIIYLPALLIIIAQFKQFKRFLRYQPYRLASYR